MDERTTERRDVAAELVGSGAQLIRIENETQMLVAVQRPRDEAKVLAAAKRELELYPSCAEGAIYCKPVGKDENGVMQWARQLSIRAAESLAVRWGNSAWAGGVADLDANGATVYATYVDFESNTRHAMTRRVSRHYKGRDGIIRETPEDRFADVVLPAAISKLLRECINRSLPAGLREEYRREAERRIPPLSDAGKKRLLAAFATKGISARDIEEAIGKPLLHATEGDLTNLRGWYQSLEEDGEAPNGAPGGGEKPRPSPKPVVGSGIRPDAEPPGKRSHGQRRSKVPANPISPRPPEETPQTHPPDGRALIIAEIENALTGATAEEKAQLDGALMDICDLGEDWKSLDAARLNQLLSTVRDIVAARESQ